MPKRSLSYLKSRKCCKCNNGTDEYSQWHYHKCNKKDCSGYLCHNCYNFMERLKNSEIKENYKKSYFKGRVCYKCRSDSTYASSSTTPRWYKYIDDNGYWDRVSYLCHNCYNQKYHDDEIKPMFDCRNKNLDPSSPPGKGFIGQQIVSKTLGVDDCNLKMDNFHFYIDLSKCSHYGYGEVKIASMIGREWHFGKLDRSCDTFFFVCMDESWPWKYVKRVYIVPSIELIGKTDIHIHEDWSKVRRGSKFEWLKNYRVDEMSCKDYNDTYHNLDLEKCKVLKY